MTLMDITGQHAGHLVSYNEECTYAREVIGLDGDGNILTRDEGDVAQIMETFLYCETCDQPVTGEELGGHPEWEVFTDPQIELPSGWSYRAQQENGDNVDCHSCGNPLNDDHAIVNDNDGFAYHESCLSPEHRA